MDALSQRGCLEPSNIPVSQPFLSKDHVDRVLGTARSRLGMDVGFISEFCGERRVFRYISENTPRSRMKVGDSISLDYGYCKKIVEGQLPELIPDTALAPAVISILATREIPIGAHVGVPLRLADGRIYGTFCCFSFEAVPRLSERDLLLMKAFGEVVAYQIEAHTQTSRNFLEKRDRILAILQSDEPSIVYQPVFRLSDMKLVAAEALSRFQVRPQRSPDKWFAEASEVGLKTELEIKAIQGALTKYRCLWKRGPLYLAINCSPQTIMNGHVLEAIVDFPAERIILEITEHDHVENYKELLGALAPLRARGVAIAIDDAGSGYASMRHILNVRPDYIKLDINLTHGLDADRKQRALAKALIEFARDTDCKIVAEGVETEAEMKALRDLGAHAAQGWLLGHPLPIEELWRKVF